jgi:hypothetical protein
MSGERRGLDFELGQKTKMVLQNIGVETAYNRGRTICNKTNKDCIVIEGAVSL